jgi:hypothetical protein
VPGLDDELASFEVENDAREGLAGAFEPLLALDTSFTVELDAIGGSPSEGTGLGRWRLPASVGAVLVRWRRL